MSNETETTETVAETGGFLRKISVKTVCGKQTLEMIVEKKAYPLMQVYGHAQRVKEGTTDFGSYQKLLGQFEAVNLATGQVFQSPQCIMPEPANGMVAGQLLGDNPAEQVSFALEIGIKRDESSSVGYTYTTKQLVKAQDADPLADLRGKVKALEAPKEKDEPPVIDEPEKASAKTPPKKK